jgi:hypothetical protein
MKKSLLTMACLLAFFSVVSQTYLINDVNVVDVINGTTIPGTSVLITDGYIAKVARKIRAPKGCTLVEGKGQFLISGLWDMHVHSTDTTEAKANWPLFVAHGVTGVRDMGGNGIVALKKSKEMISSGAVVGPRLYGAGNLLDGRPVVFPDQLPIQINNIQDVHHFVDSMIMGGADFIKAYEMLSKENFTSLISYATQKGKKVVGHVPITVTVEEAADLGMHSMEHLRGFDYSTSVKQDSIVKAQRSIIDTTTTTNGARLRSQLLATRFRVAYQNFDSLNAIRLIALLKKKNVYQTPTLVVASSVWFAFRLDTTTSYKAVRKYMSSKRLKLWDSLYRIRPASAVDQMILKQRFRLVKMMADQNVSMLTGTDVNNPYIVPGFSLHQELVLMQTAGVPPAIILRAATANAAECLGVERYSGTIEENKWADLVMLTQNPLEDVANTQKISAVFLRGKHYTKDDLATLLREVEEANARMK